MHKKGRFANRKNTFNSILILMIIIVAVLAVVTLAISLIQNWEVTSDFIQNLLLSPRNRKGLTCVDSDLDRWNSTSSCNYNNLKDCNDNNAQIYPGAMEICNDNLDNNCDGLINEGCSIVNTTNVTFRLNSLGYSSQNNSLFKASTFYNGQTSQVEDAYFNDMGNYRATRINYFEYYLGASTDVNSFINGLNKETTKLQKMSNNSDVLIVVIAKMPYWLSSSQDTSLASYGDWRVYNTHSPRDYQQWRETIKAGVTYFKQFGKPVYYEFWNEPDFDFFWSEDTNSYLKLYNETAFAIKEADPNAKIGGSAVNKWNGKIDSNRDMANMELIKYAKQNNVPLDFVSWHYFSTNIGDIVSAKQNYSQALSNNGYVYAPKFIISEWNNPQVVRTSIYAPVILADSLLSIHLVKLDYLTYSAFSDFSSVSDNSGYGLVKYDGTKKSVYYTYKEFNNLAKNSIGLNVSVKGIERKIISKRVNNCYDILLWNVNVSTNSTINYNWSVDGNVVSLSGIGVRENVSAKNLNFSGNRVWFDTKTNEFNSLNICLQ